MELPVVNGGGLTSGFVGLETRLSQTLPFDLDPFVFMDFGEISNSAALLSAPLYWSPGVGVRWASPIGPVRTTLAHGFVGNSADHFQFYLSLGEEF
jgi:outer membrane translocation and assembly module TamA